MEWIHLETEWLHKAETEIREHFPQADIVFEPFDCGLADIVFEPFDCGLQLGISVKIGELRRAIRLEMGDDWIKRTADLIDEMAKMSVP